MQEALFEMGIKTELACICDGYTLVPTLLERVDMGNAVGWIYLLYVAAGKIIRRLFLDFSLFFFLVDMAGGLTHTERAVREGVSSLALSKQVPIPWQEGFAWRLASLFISCFCFEA